jgi:hypothetical protein
VGGNYSGGTDNMKYILTYQWMVNNSGGTDNMKYIKYILTY